jgi:hypothetical protein
LQEYFNIKKTIDGNKNITKKGQLRQRELDPFQIKINAAS